MNQTPNKSKLIKTDIDFPELKYQNNNQFQWM